MFVHETRGRIHKPKQDWEPRPAAVRSAGHHAGTGAVIGLTLAGVKVGSCPRRFSKNTRWSKDGLLELRGFPIDLQPRNRDMPDSLADEAA